MQKSTQPKGWKVACASVKGTSHTKLGLPCQDAHDLSVQGGFLIAAIADGAGSAAKAEVGSRVATEAVKTRLSNILRASSPNTDVDLIQRAILDAIHAARIALENEATRDGIDLRGFATTLITIVASREFVVVAQIGDGGVVGYFREELRTLTQPPVGEYINEATFLTSDNYRDAIQVAVDRQCPSGIAAFTDGLQMLALTYPSGQPFDRFFIPLFAAMDERDAEVDLSPDLEVLLNSARVNERTDDDKTLLLAALT